MKRTWIPIVIAMIAGGCAGQQERSADSMAASEGGEDALRRGQSIEPRRIAVATLEAAEGEGIEGNVTLTEQGDGSVLVEVRATGVKPGSHGIHVHEVGECSGPGFESAGGHFAGGGERHGSPTEPDSHAGDLGNLEVGDDGVVRYTIRRDVLSLGDRETSVIGKSIVIHHKPDDLESQPAGDSGRRIACGVIRPLG